MEQFQLEPEDVIRQLQESLVETTLALTFARAHITALTKKLEEKNAE
jgi:uncharacterized coiled-coil protein SlyX